jgi:hypothetical protein
MELGASWLSSRSLAIRHTGSVSKHVCLLLAILPFLLLPQPLANGSAEGPGVCPEWGAGLMSTLTFSWLSPLIKQGYKTPLQDKDIWSLPPTDRWVVLWGFMVGYGGGVGGEGIRTGCRQPELLLNAKGGEGVRRLVRACQTSDQARLQDTPAG